MVLPAVVSRGLSVGFFEKEHGSRTISASEMLGTLVALELFVTDRGGSSGVARMQGLTGNSSNTFTVKKLYTSAFPTAAVLMQLASSLAKKKLWLSLDWLPRDDNKPADALTNEDFSEFSIDKRIAVSLSSFKFEMMHQLLALSPHFVKTRAELKLLKDSGPASVARTKRAKLATKTKWQ